MKSAKMDQKLDALTLAERLKCEQKEYWMHFEAASSLDKYPAKQHARRVQEKLGTEDGLVYLPGEPARNNEDSDMPAPFRQRRYFYYLSGCNEPDCHVTYDIENDSLALFIPRINPSRVIWNGRGSTPAEALEKYDIDQVFYIDQLQDFLQDWAESSHGSLYVLHQAQNPLIPGLREPVDTESLLPAINLARLVKDEYEIALIRKANDISSQAHKEVLANIRNFKNEAQVEGLFLDVCVSRRAKQQAYDPIAASGPNAGTLHYDDNDQDFEDRQLMCLDAGCEWELYASDITRTFPLSGKWPSEEAKNVYQLVQRMQETCIQGLKPGVRYLDLHILAHQIAIDGLLSLGILHNGSREEIYKAGTSKAFFPHGLGHHVGLEVHDPGQADLMSMTKGNPMYEMAPSVFPKDFHLPVYDPETCRSPVDVLSGHLEEGMVLTVEPGIYFSPYALKNFYLPSPIHSKYINVSVVGQYLPVGGVRIEDNLLITSRGYENLTKAPKGEAMLEIIQSQNAQWPFVSDSADLGPATSTAPEEPLLRAPGFPRHTPEPVLKPIVRASTAPVKRTVNRHSVDTVDFEPFDGPSLFSNFNLKRSSTTDDNVKRWREARGRSGPKRKTVCGEFSADFTHAYLDFPSEGRQVDPAATRLTLAEKKPICRKCTILVEAVDRLRENLNKSDSGYPSPKPKLEPAATRKIHEMEQLGHRITASPIIDSPRESKHVISEGARACEEKIPIWAKPIDSTNDESRVDTLEGFDFEAFLGAEEDATIPTRPRPETATLHQDRARIGMSLACWACDRRNLRCINTGIGNVCKSCTIQKRSCVYPESDLSERGLPYSRASIPQPSLPGIQYEFIGGKTAADAKTNVEAISTLPISKKTASEAPLVQRLLWDTLPAISAQAAERNGLVCEHCRRSKIRCVRWSLSAPCTACVGVGRDCSTSDTTSALPRTSTIQRMYESKSKKTGDPSPESSNHIIPKPPPPPHIKEDFLPQPNAQDKQAPYKSVPQSPPPDSGIPPEITWTLPTRPFKIPSRPTQSTPRTAIPKAQTQNQPSCVVCRRRRKYCRRDTPTGSCATCDESGFLCDYESRREGVAEVVVRPDAEWA